MILKDDDLKRLYQEYIRDRTSDDRKECPGPVIFVEIATPGARISNRRKLLNHISQCSKCSGELRFILDINEESKALSSRLTPTRKSCFLSRFRSLMPAHSPLFFRFAFAFFGIVMTIISLFLIVQRQDPQIGFRSVKPSVVLQSPINIHSSSTPLLFEWQDLPKAEYYLLELYDEELLPVWSSPSLPDCRLLLPNDVVRRLSIDKPYYWMVTAFSNNEKIADSDLVHFVLRDQ